MQVSTILFASLTAFFLSLIGYFLLIPALRKLKAGQNILSYVQEHHKKSGTPTMGGIVFITASVIANLCFIKALDRTFVYDDRTSRRRVKNEKKREFRANRITKNHLSSHGCSPCHRVRVECWINYLERPFFE